jgi:hypothetical protein
MDSTEADSRNGSAVFKEVSGSVSVRERSSTMLSRRIDEDRPSADFGRGGEFDLRCLARTASASPFCGRGALPSSDAFKVGLGTKSPAGDGEGEETLNARPVLLLFDVSYSSSEGRFTPFNDAYERKR